MLFWSDMKAKQTLYSQYGDSYGMLRTLLTDGTTANILYRLQNFFGSKFGKPFGLPFHVLNKWLNGCVIGIGADFGPGFVLIHPIGVVINASVKGAANVWIESSVVIGDNRGGSPILGNNIFIGSGAKVVGSLQVGDHARIGANAVVLKTIPANATAVGVPAVIRLQRSS